jgi:hypothetical protein
MQQTSTKHKSSGLASKHSTEGAYEIGAADFRMEKAKPKMMPRGA